LHITNKGLILPKIYIQKMGNNHVYVLLAVRNGERYIRYAIESVLNQTHQNFNIFILVNGCTDNTQKIVNEYSVQYPTKIKDFTMLNDANKSGSLNYGISIALDYASKLYGFPKSEWFAIQDADDVWHPTKLEEQLKYANAYDVIGTDCYYIDAQSKEIEINPRPRPFLHDKIVEDAYNGHNPIVNCSALIRANLMQQFPYNPELDGIEDYDLWLRIMRYTDSKFINIPQKLVDHRIHANSHFNTKNYTEKINQLIQTYKQK
jgi:glycosyltransferase involved in cell wall biosynthesis